MNKLFEGFLVRRKSISKLVKLDDINNRNPILVPNSMVSKYKLNHGLRMTVTYSEQKDGKFFIDEIKNICGKDPDVYFERKGIANSTPINPYERFKFDKSKYRSLRVIDKFAPIGKGTRALIVAPPRSGKTTLIREMACELKKNYPEVMPIVVLVDERPEEITDFTRETGAVVLASSNDQSLSSHTFITSLAISIAKNELACGNDAVLLVDSLTRIGRVYNLNSRNRGKTMSGGMSAGSLEIPRKFFGMARKLEDGGSLTIIATILVDTGSRMDTLIYEEFKGTGNCDIVLDRDLADDRIYPAFNIKKSATRRDDLFYSSEQYENLNDERRVYLLLDKFEAIRKMK